MTAEQWPAQDLEAVGCCPVCGEPRRSILYENLTDREFFCAPGHWTLLSCDRCRSAYLDPRPTLDSIGRAYAEYYTHDAVPQPTDWSRAPASGVSRFRWSLRFGYLNARYGYSFRPASRLGRWLMPLFPRTRERADRWTRHLPRTSASPALLDVGCGDGVFLREMRAVGWEVAGIDPDPKSVALAQGAGLDIHEGALAEGVFPEASFDAITLNHTIEHFHDPLEALRVCRWLLRPGGVLWIATPNLEARGHAQFGSDWIGLDPPRHLVLFTTRSLAAAIERAGFDMLERPAIRVAAGTFRQSAALARGFEPFTDPPPLPRGLALRARLADARVLVQPAVAEEAIVLAQKPGSG